MKGVQILEVLTIQFSTAPCYYIPSYVQT